MTDIELGSAGNGQTYNGQTVGAGWDCDIRRESPRTAIVNLVRVGANHDDEPDSDLLFDLELEADTDLQALAVEFACGGPGPLDGNYVTSEDDEWDELAGRWDALAGERWGYGPDAAPVSRAARAIFLRREEGEWTYQPDEGGPRRAWRGEVYEVCPDLPADAAAAAAKRRAMELYGARAAN